MKNIQITLLFLLLLFSALGLAQNDESDNLKSSEIDQKILKLQQSNSVYQRIIKNLIQRLEKLEDAPQQKTDSNEAEIEEKKNEITINPEVRARLEKESEENSKLINAAFEQRLSKEGGMLLDKYEFIYEPGLSFSHSSYDNIVVDGFTVFPVLVVGDIVSEKVNRDILTINQSLRFGLGRDIQLNIFIPLGYEEQSTFREDGFHEEKKASGLGDVSLGISYQLIKSHADLPDTLVGFDWKTKTGKDPYRLNSADELAIGSGFHTFGLSLTSITNSDPVVLFGGYSINYTQADRKEIGDVKPGISHGMNLGMALALNFDTSLSFNFQYLHSENTTINGQRIKGSGVTTSTFAMGLSIAKGGGYSVDVDLGIGLTAESPDFQLTLSFPLNYSFD